jgi:hypothetical protein
MRVLGAPRSLVLGRGWYVERLSERFVAVLAPSGNPPIFDFVVFLLGRAAMHRPRSERNP